MYGDPADFDQKWCMRDGAGELAGTRIMGLSTVSVHTDSVWVAPEDEIKCSRCSTQTGGRCSEWTHSAVFMECRNFRMVEMKTRHGVDFAHSSLNTMENRMEHIEMVVEENW